MTRTRRISSGALGIVCLLSFIAQDASAAEILGLIWDATGSVLPEARITIANVETGVLRRTVSNGSGYYSIPALQPGVYSLTAQRDGFMVTTNGAVKLEVNQRLRMDVTLSVAQVAERVDVEAAGLLDSDSASLGDAVSQKAVEALPLNGRNYTALLTLTTGATPVSTAQGSVAGSNDGSVTAIPDTPVVRPSFNGQQNRSQIVYLDGIINTDFRISTYAVLPNLDLLQEFRVQSHDDRVEIGGVTGGVINLISKSGTNEFHGTAFWAVRNDALDARDPFKDAQRSSPAPFRQNQFGASLLGPILRDRAFFSAGYEGWRYRKPSQIFGRVPDAAELAGDFSSSIAGRDIYDPYTTRRGPDGALVRDPIVNNRIPEARISSQMRGFLETYADPPNYLDPVHNFINASSARDDSESFQVKVDDHTTRRDDVFFRWSRMTRAAVNPGGLKSSTDSVMTADNYGGGWTHFFAPTLSLGVRAGVARRDFERLFPHREGLEGLRRLGFADVDRFAGVGVRLSSPWGEVNPRGPEVRENPTRSVSADLTWVRGDHTFKAGYQRIGVRRLQTNQFQSYEFDDQATSDPQMLGTTGVSLASALLGLPSRFTGELPDEGTIDFGSASWSGYFQDEWRVRPSLTINAGLRFDHNDAPSLRGGLMAGPDLDTGRYLIGAETMPPPCDLVLQAPCIPGSGLAAIPHGDRIVLAGSPSFIPKEIWDNWGPRVGIAWRASEKTVVRAGYGLYWDALIGNSQYIQHNVEARWPASPGFLGSANGLDEAPRRIEDIQGRFPHVLPEPTPWNLTGWTNDPDRKNAYSHQWNLEIQRQLDPNLMASVAYVGSSNGRLDYSGLANTAPAPGPGSPEEVDARRPVPYMGGGFLYSRSIGRSHYNAFQLKVRRRFSEGFQSQLSYTWSKSIDTSSGWFGVENGPGGSAGVQNYHDPASNRSVSSYDVPHYVSWYTVWEPSFGKGKARFRRGLGRALLGDWQMSSIVSWRSGQPFNLAVNGDVANIGAERRNWRYARPNLVGDPRLGGRTVDRYFNTDAFAIPRFAFGNFGRNVLRSDAVFNADLSLFRNVRLQADGEARLQVRLEAFNLFNHIDWAPPGTNIGEAGAGRVTEAAHAPRVLQLGLRFSF